MCLIGCKCIKYILKRTDDYLKIYSCTCQITYIQLRKKLGGLLGGRTKKKKLQIKWEYDIPTKCFFPATYNMANRAASPFFVLHTTFCFSRSGTKCCFLILGIDLLVINWLVGCRLNYKPVIDLGSCRFHWGRLWSLVW